MIIQAVVIVAAHRARGSFGASLNIREVAGFVCVMSLLHPQLSCRPQGIRRRRAYLDQSLPTGRTAEGVGSAEARLCLRCPQHSSTA
jgi:hypothetical protein